VFSSVDNLVMGEKPSAKTMNSFIKTLTTSEQDNRMARNHS